MDAFYVSVERRENPSLIGKRVIVGADPKGGKGRGVVMACSYEAREIGIRSGMPIGLAWRKAPDAIYLRPNYDLYGSVSESVIDVLRSFADILEHVSIDEAFLDVSTKVHGFDDAAAYALRVKAAVREREGLACTIGGAPNKSVAKIAEVLERVGVRTIGELARFKGANLKKILGKNAVWLWGIARGLEQLPVEERPDPKSISVERTFDRDVVEWNRVEDTYRDVAHNVYLRARAQGAAFRTIGIKIRFEGFQTHLRERTLASHVMDEEVLAEVCHDLIAEFADKAHRVRLVGVRVTHLVRPKTRQPKLSSFE